MEFLYKQTISIMEQSPVKPMRQFSFMPMRHSSFILPLLFLMWFLAPLSAPAQCTHRNTAFKSGETLVYNLYYNWQFIWVKAGSASMTTVQTVKDGQQVWQSSLITRGNNKVDHFFVLRDTLLCRSSLDMAPLYFRKGAREGRHYTVDEVFYDYAGGKTHVRQHRQASNGDHHWEEHTYDDCIYDMMNIFLRARSFNPESWKTGHVVSFPIADGNSRTPAQLYYRGKETVKADNGRKYKCLVLSYMELEKGKYKEYVRFFVTDDANHVPVRLDMFLRFGSAKAFLTGMSGLRSGVTSEVRN